MLGIILKLLALLGLLLLFATLLLLSLLLLVTIYPISYRILWEKNADLMAVKAKASWLMGLLNARFEYPSPGNVVVKLLGITVYDSGKSKEEPGNKKTKPKKDADVRKTNQVQSDTTDGPEINRADIDGSPDKMQNDASTHSDHGFKARFCNIIKKIKDKAKQIIEKIKKIRELAEYYIKLLKEEDTTQLLSKIFTGSGKLLKSIRPRKIKGQILLGTGSPDTTGYTMALYGILSPYLGQNLVLTPDFEEKVLEGHLLIKGRVVVGILLFHGGRIALDRKLHLFIKRLKREVI